MHNGKKKRKDDKKRKTLNSRWYSSFSASGCKVTSHFLFLQPCPSLPAPTSSQSLPCLLELYIRIHPVCFRLFPCVHCLTGTENYANLQPAEVKEFLCVLNTSLTLHCSASKRATEMATLSELVSEAKSGKEWKLKTRMAFTGRRTRLLCDYVNVQHRIIFPQLA